jgi:NCK-associated protein 1
LAQLIGPYGIKLIEEKLVWHIASQITELFKIVRENREALHVARVNYDKPAKLKEVFFIIEFIFIPKNRLLHH